MKQIFLLTILSLVFNACGGSSSNTVKDSILITEICNDQNDSTLYHSLESGDIISKPETLNGSFQSDPEIQIFHKQDGTKSVCIKSGTAVILR